MKSSEIVNLEIFSPGTAGERAIRIEKRNGEVEIIPEDENTEIDFHATETNKLIDKLLKESKEPRFYEQDE